MHALGGLRPYGDGARLRRVRESVEESRRHLRAAGVLDAGEDDRRSSGHRAASSAASCGTSTRGATSGSAGTSQRNRAVAPAAPRSCATMKPGVSAGRIPAKVSVADRASVTAGLAKLVEAVNQ